MARCSDNWVWLIAIILFFYSYRSQITIECSKIPGIKSLFSFEVVAMIVIIVVAFLLLKVLFKWSKIEDKEEIKMEDESEEVYKCVRCEKEFDEDDLYECIECGDFFCEDCMLPSENIDICFGCVDKLYPREEKVKEVIKYVPKESEKSVIGDNYFD